MEHIPNKNIVNGAVESKKPRRSYKRVTDEQRLEVIDLVEQKKFSFREVSRRLRIKHENVRSIYRVYLVENRTTHIRRCDQ